MAAMIRVDLLGGVDVSGADPAQLRSSSRAVLLLGFLASHPESPQPRAFLAGLLWPDSEDSQARTNLRRELHHLRALLGGSHCLRVDAHALCWLDDPECAVDVQDFLTTCRRARVAAESMERAGVAGYWLSCEEPAAAAVFARRRIMLEPLEEAGYRTLMRAQRMGGDRAGAMRTYHQCASVLERELGVGPSPSTRTELDAALTDAHRAPEGAGAAVGSARSLAPELVGRTIEQARLLSAWNQAQAGSQFLVVVGEAGVGKSRLVADLAASVRKQGALVVMTRCFAATGAVPLAPVADWLGNPHLRLAARRLEPVWRAEVDRLVPEGDGTSDPGAGVRAKVDAWQRLRFFEGLARAVLSVDRPLVLTVDDLQRCDRATLSWLSFLMSVPSPLPLLVLATARNDDFPPSELAARLDAMRAAGQAQVLALDNLTSAAAAQLVAGVLGHGVSEVEPGLLMSATGGNPLFLLEAVRTASSSPGPVAPADLRGVLEGRLSRLCEPAREVVSLAVAVGRDFTLDLLIEACDLSEDLVVQQVDDLWRRRILQEHGRGYGFAHDLLREAAYAMISPPKRWLLHRRLAQALELLWSDRLDVVAAQIAEHHDRSGQSERALPFYERAARQATAVFAHAESVRFWQRCLALLGELPDSGARDRRELEVLQELLPPLNAWRGYASPELEQYERRSELLGERLGLPDVCCTAAIALFTSTFVQGNTRESHDWGQRALALSEQRPELAAQAHLALAGSGVGLGLLLPADESFRLSCDLAGESDSLPIGTRTEVHARAWWAHARWLLGDPLRAVAARADAVAAARTIPTRTR